MKGFCSLLQGLDIYRRLAFLWIVNRLCTQSITNVNGPVVSLTTHGNRAKTVYLAIESIGRGTVRPSRLILWVHEEWIREDCPAELRRLQKRGLEVRTCDDVGPHKKYYPYVVSSEPLDVPLVTADDDIMYPRSWLKGLVEEFRKHPDVVNCYRARVMELEGAKLANYSSWRFASSTRASFRRFAGSGAGAIYGPPLQRAFRDGGLQFISCCPKADDIWLHVQAIRAGYMTRQIANKKSRLITIPNTQGCSLWRTNVAGNDAQVSATYTAEDLRVLESE